MNILIACEESQAVCKEFRKLGHNAYSCDIQQCSGGHPEWHINCDIFWVLNPFSYFSSDKTSVKFGIPFNTQDGKYHEIIGKWDLIIAHPPCTYLSKAGARWLYSNNSLNVERYNKGLLAKKFFLDIYYCNCDNVVIENPTPLKIFELPKCSQVIQPYQFGEPYSKRTLLWIKGNLPLLKPTNILDSYVPYIDSNCSKAARGLGKGYLNGVKGAKERSKTFVGIASAMAEQWG